MIAGGGGAWWPEAREDEAMVFSMFERTEAVRGSRVDDDMPCAGGVLRNRFGDGDRVKPNDELRLLRCCAVGDELHH